MFGNATLMDFVGDYSTYDTYDVVPILGQCLFEQGSWQLQGCAKR